MVDYPVVYGPNAVPVQFICLVDAEGDPTVVSFITGPVTIADGANVALGHTTDSAGTSTVVGLLKELSAQWAQGLTQTIGVNLNTSGLATETTLELLAAAVSGGRVLVTTQDGTATTPKGYTQLANASIATASGLGAPGGSTRAVLRVEGGNGIRWRDDGVNPTAAIGMPLYPGESLEVKIANLNTFKMIAVDGTTIVNIAFYG